MDGVPEIDEYQTDQYQQDVGYGESPAIVVIDLAKYWTEPDSPAGSYLEPVIERTNELLEVADENDVPILLTRIIHRHPELGEGGGSRGLRMKVRTFPAQEKLTPGAEETEFDPRLDSEKGDFVVNKQHSSVFHRADIDVSFLLRNMGVDTVILTGCSTSGCVRASASMGHADGFHVVLPESAVGDRSEQQHRSHLAAIDAKYGDVRPIDEVKAYLETPEEYADPL
jgi:nicotinamidase-related amidase